MRSDSASRHGRRQALDLSLLTGPDVVPETVGSRFREPTNRRRSGPVASVRPGRTEPSPRSASFAAFSTTAVPAGTIGSASETCLPPAPLKSCWIPSTRAQHGGQLGRLVHVPIFCGARQMRAPLAPPRLSVPRKLAANAHAVFTSWDTDRPDPSTFSLSEACRTRRWGRR